jgi:hypothetical protein
MSLEQRELTDRASRTSLRARRLIYGASFGPDTLKAIGQAFDKAWAQIAGNFGNDPSDIERARLRLANAMLSVASEDCHDVAVRTQSQWSNSFEIYWRDRAEEGRAISANIRNPQCKRIMQELAATYEHLARLTVEFKSAAGTPASSFEMRSKISNSESRSAAKNPSDRCGAKRH